jgi:hypothetical protein
MNIKYGYEVAIEKVRDFQELKEDTEAIEELERCK